MERVSYMRVNELDNTSYLNLLEEIKMTYGHDKYTSNINVLDDNTSYTDVELFHKHTINTIRTKTSYDALELAQQYRFLLGDSAADNDMALLIGYILYTGSQTCAIGWAEKIGTHLEEIAYFILNLGNPIYVLQWTLISDEYFKVMEKYYCRIASFDHLVDWVLAHKNNIDKCYMVKDQLICYHSEVFQKYGEYRGLSEKELYLDMYDNDNNVKTNSLGVR